LLIRLEVSSTFRLVNNGIIYNSSKSCLDFGTTNQTEHVAKLFLFKKIPNVTTVRVTSCATETEIITHWKRNCKVCVCVFSLSALALALTHKHIYRVFQK
jgi:hypothetical protein